MTEPPQPGRVAVYLSHIKGIVLPGEEVAGFKAYQIDAAEIVDWKDQDLTIVLESGRAQLERQNSNLEAIRSRAQFVLTLALAFVGIAVASAEFVGRTAIAQVPWALGIGIAFVSALGAGGVIVARKELGMVDTRLLTNQDPPLLPVAARAFADSVAAGENTVATEITVLRDSVALFLVSFVLVCGGWLVAAAS